MAFSESSAQDSNQEIDHDILDNGEKSSGMEEEMIIEPRSVGILKTKINNFLIHNNQDSKRSNGQKIEK